MRSIRLLHQGFFSSSIQVPSSGFSEKRAYHIAKRKVFVNDKICQHGNPFLAVLYDLPFPEKRVLSRKRGLRL
jgi:hypothetical protein